MHVGLRHRRTGRGLLHFYGLRLIVRPWSRRTGVCRKITARNNGSLLLFFGLDWQGNTPCLRLLFTRLRHFRRCGILPVPSTVTSIPVT